MSDLTIVVENPDLVIETPEGALELVATGGTLELVPSGTPGPDGPEGPQGVQGSQGEPWAVAISEQSGTTHELTGEANYVRMTATEANTVTVPVLDLVTGFQITIVQAGIGETTILGADGVTINSPETTKLRKQFCSATLVYLGENTWDLNGGLETL